MRTTKLQGLSLSILSGFLISGVTLPARADQDRNEGYNASNFNQNNNYNPPFYGPNFHPSVIKQAFNSGNYNQAYAQQALYNQAFNQQNHGRFRDRDCDNDGDGDHEKGSREWRQGLTGNNNQQFPGFKQGRWQNFYNTVTSNNGFNNAANNLNNGYFPGNNYNAVNNGYFSGYSNGPASNLYNNSFVGNNYNNASAAINRLRNALHF